MYIIVQKFHIKNHKLEYLLLQFIGITVAFLCPDFLISSSIVSKFYYQNYGVMKDDTFMLCF